MEMGFIVHCVKRKLTWEEYQKYMIEVFEDNIMTCSKLDTLLLEKWVSYK